MRRGMKSIWVVGKYDGLAAKTILANAHAGVGSYIVLEQTGNAMNPSCTVAFRKAVDSNPLPHHLLEVIDPKKIQEYERTRKDRQGLIN